MCVFRCVCVCVCVRARASTHTHTRTHTHTYTYTQVCGPCFYHGSHTFSYSDDGTKMKNVTIDSLTERTVGRNDMAWGLMDEMVCKYGTCL